MTISELHIDSAMSNMAGSLCRNLAFVPAPGAALRSVKKIYKKGLDVI